MFEKKLLFSIAILLALLLFDPRYGLASSNESLSAVPGSNKVDYKTIVSQSDLLALLYLGAERDWLVAIINKPQKSNLPRCSISFYRRAANAAFQKLYEFETIDSFRTAYTSIERDRLFTVWTTGSAHRLKIFSVNKNVPREVLSVGWKREPEFVHLTRDIELEILVPIEEFPQQEPKFAEIYRWNGENYILVDKVPWGARFRSLQAN